MAGRLLSSTLMANAEEVADFLGNLLESSTEYSMVGKDLEDTPPSQEKVSNGKRPGS